MPFISLPTTEVANTGFALVGGSDLVAIVAKGVDSGDDTSYVETANETNSLEVALDPPPFTPEVGAGHAVRFRAASNSAGSSLGEVEVTVHADRIGGIGGFVVYTSGKVTLTSSMANYEYDIGLSDPLDDYLALAIQITDVGTSTSDRIRVNSVELKIPGQVSITGSTDGSSGTSAALTGIGSLVGTSSGSSATSAACGGLGALSGSCAADSQVAGALSGVAPGTGSSSSSSTVSGTGMRAAVGSGTSSGSSTLSATVQGFGTLVGAITSTSTVSALLIDSSGIGPYELISNAVRLRFQQSVGGPESLPVAWDNAPFAHPGQTTWARVKVRVGEARQIAIGVANDYRKEGMMTVSFYTPLGAGDQAALALAGLVKDAFRLVQADPITYGVPSVRPGSRDGAFWRVDVTVPFVADFTLDRITGALPDNALTFEEAANIARSRFSSVAETSLGLEVVYDGEDDEAPEVDATFVRCSVLQGDSALVGLGAQRAYRTQGLVMAAIYVPVESGEKDGLSAADTIADYFRAVTDRGVTFKTPLVRSSEREGAWWRIGVVCPFQWDEVSA